MPKFKVEAPSAHEPTETYKKIKHFLENADDLKKIDSNIVCNFEDSKLKGQAKGKQFKAEISVQKGNPQCIVCIEVEIPFLLTPLKGKIQESLERKIKKALV